MTTIYENKYIRLRQAKIEDAEALFHLTQQKEVMKYYGAAPYTTLGQAKAEIEWFLSLEEKGQGARWVIADMHSNQYIGDIGLFHYQEKHRRVEIGFKLSMDYWNRGIMSECIRQTLAYGFGVRKYNRIEALADTRNNGCQKTLLKNGFQLEGVLREYEFENGHFVDLQMYSKLQRDHKL